MAVEQLVVHGGATPVDCEKLTSRRLKPHADVAPSVEQRAAAKLMAELHATQTHLDVASIRALGSRARRQSRLRREDVLTDLSNSRGRRFRGRDVWDGRGNRRRRWRRGRRHIRWRRRSRWHLGRRRGRERRRHGVLELSAGLPREDSGRGSAVLRARCVPVRGLPDHSRRRELRRWRLEAGVVSVPERTRLSAVHSVTRNLLVVSTRGRVHLRRPMLRRYEHVDVLERLEGSSRSLLVALPNIPRLVSAPEQGVSGLRRSASGEGLPPLLPWRVPHAACVGGAWQDAVEWDVGCNDG
jgi:hypothetical protein